MLNYLIGTLLLLWLVWDLRTGSVYLHRPFFYKTEPVAYVLINLFWALVAISFFLWS